MNNWKLVVCLLVCHFCGGIQLVAKSLSSDTCKVFTSWRNVQHNKYQEATDFDMVQPVNNVHFSQQENEIYFFKKYNKRSLPFILKSYNMIAFKDDIYLNAERLGIGFGFNKLLTDGRYWVVMSAKPQHATGNLDIKYDDSTGMFIPDSTSINIRHYMYYAIDTKNMETTALTFAGMLKILSQYPSLQMQFVKDKYNDEPSRIIAYVQELNRYINYFEQRKTP